MWNELKKISQNALEKSLPIIVEIGDDKYTAKIINGDEYTLYKNDEQIYATADGVESYLLAELCLNMMDSFIQYISKDEKREKVYIKVLFEVINSELIDKLSDNNLLDSEQIELLKRLISSVTGRKWNVREV